MPGLSDVIEKFIKELIEECDKGILEIQRNQLADYFNCAPSQINYVLSTRFTIDRGYYIQSRRGGGGYIKIQRLDIDSKQYLGSIMHEHIGDSISQFEALGIIRALAERGIITPREQLMMQSAVNSKTINVFSPSKDEVRASILKAMISSLLQRK